MPTIYLVFILVSGAVGFVRVGATNASEVEKLSYVFGLPASVAALRFIGTNGPGWAVAWVILATAMAVAARELITTRRRAASSMRSAEERDQPGNP